MLGFCIVAPVGDAVVKMLGDSIPLGEMLIVRFGLQALVLIPLVYATRRIWRMRGRVLALTALRTGMHIFGIGAMFTALQYLPLADAVAIAFVMPFILLLLGKYFLNEEVGPRRLIACAIGFAGTLMVVQPSFVEVGWPALLPLVVAVNFSFFILVTRQIAKDTDPIGLQAVSGVMAVVVMVPLVLFGDMFDIAPLALVAPDSFEWSLLIATGVLGTVAHLLMTWSLRYAPSATLAPMQYLEIPIATLLGWMVFQDLPNTLASVGICVTIAAGLFIILVESRLARMQNQTPPDAPQQPVEIAPAPPLPALRADQPPYYRSAGFGIGQPVTFARAAVSLPAMPRRKRAA